MNDASLLPVIIVGGGFSGAMLAARLAERGQASVLIERGEQNATLLTVHETAQALQVKPADLLADPPSDSEA